MATYIADSGSSDRFAQLTGTFTTDEVDKTTTFGGDGEADTGFILPDDGSEWMLVEVFDVEDVAGDVGYTLFKSQVRNLAADMVTARAVATAEYTLYTITCTHYYGDDTADVYRGDESTALALAGGDTGISYTPLGTNWKITDTAIAPSSAGQTYNTAIVIDYTKVAGTGSHSDFPVFLTEDNFITSASTMFDNCRSDGGDLRFYSDSGGVTQIPHEIASINTAGDEIEIYVSVPSLSTSGDTTIYVRYGDSGLTMEAVGSTYGRNAVWADYDRVFHFNDLPLTDGELTDSTGNSTDNTTVGTWADNAKVVGPTKNGWQFGGSNGIDVPTLDYDYEAVSNITIAFTYPDATDFTAQYILTQGQDTNPTTLISHSAYDDQPSLINGGEWDGTNGTDFPFDLPVIMTARSWNDSGWRCDVEFDCSVSISGSRYSGTASTTANMLIGGTHTATPTEFDTTSGWLGIISEIRINGTTDKEVDWLTTERENLYNVDTFAEASTPSAL